MKSIYSASGEKLRNVLPGKTLDYVGNFVYEGSALRYILTGEGRYVVNGLIGTYEYNLTDHLGNVRAVINQDGNVIQTTDYYPFGMPITQTGSSTNNYLYSGKEAQEETDWFDYGARMYDATMGRWFNMDPSAETYFHISPYAYCANNPVKYIDPTGEHILIYYYDENGNECTWLFTGYNFSEAPHNWFVVQFLWAYVSNIVFGGGDKMIEAAERTDITIHLVRPRSDDHDITYLHKWRKDGQWHSEIVWDPTYGMLTSDERCIISPATALEHEFDHNLSFLSDPEGFRQREGYGEYRGLSYRASTDRQYFSTEERRVITGSEAKTAQARGEFPPGYVRPDHRGTWVKVRWSTSNYSPYYPDTYTPPRGTRPNLWTTMRRMITIIKTPPPE
jgi:RHS repeat-associated protein